MFEFYQELGGEVTEELEKLADRVENSRLIEGLFENFEKQQGQRKEFCSGRWSMFEKSFPQSVRPT